MSDRKNLKNEYRALTNQVAAIIGRGNMTMADREHVAAKQARIQDIDALLVRMDDNPYSEKPGKNKNRVEGKPGEVLRGKQTFTDWTRAAQQNNVNLVTANGVPMSMRSQGTDRDLNRYMGEVMGFAPKSVETRGLLEDTGGSAQALSPVEYAANFVDVLLPMTLMDKMNVNRVPMVRETQEIPVYTSTFSPSWVAEAGSISLDANPAFSQLTLFSPGAIKDQSTFSIELMQDAYIQGGLVRMLTDAVAKKVAVVLDQVMFAGIAGNTGVPGLWAESGFNIRHYTGDSGTTGKAPVDTTELGVIAESVVKKNIAPDFFISNVGVQQAFNRIPLSTYGKYWDMPPITANMDWLTSENASLGYAETDPATASSVARTGGAYGSVYAGPWSQFTYLGIHLDLQTVVLKERFIDSGLYALFTYIRPSIRFAHPETFFETIGVIPV